MLTPPRKPRVSTGAVGRVGRVLGEDVGLLAGIGWLAGAGGLLAGAGGFVAGVLGVAEVGDGVAGGFVVGVGGGLDGGVGGGLLEGFSSGMRTMPPLRGRAVLPEFAGDVEVVGLCEPPEEVLGAVTAGTVDGFAGGLTGEPVGGVEGEVVGAAGVWDAGLAGGVVGGFVVCGGTRVRVMLPRRAPIV